MSLTAYQVAKTQENLDDSPEKVMFGRLLTELASLSDDRIRTAAKQVSVAHLKELIYQFQLVIDSRKDESLEDLKLQMLSDGITADELRAYIEGKA